MMKGNFKTYCLQAARYYLLLNRSCCNSVSLFEHILPKLKCLDKWLWTGASKTSPQRSIVMLLLISMDNWLVLLILYYSLFLMVQMVQRSLQYMMLITVTLEENPTRLAIWILLLRVWLFLNHQIKNLASFVVVVVTPRPTSEILLFWWRSHGERIAWKPWYQLISYYLVVQMWHLMTRNFFMWCDGWKKGLLLI